PHRRRRASLAPHGEGARLVVGARGVRHGAGRGGLRGRPHRAERHPGPPRARRVLPGRDGRDRRARRGRRRHHRPARRARPRRGRRPRLAAHRGGNAGHLPKGISRMTRIALIDRPWLGYRSVMLATPLAAAPIERVRAVFAEFLRRHPEAPLACRIDGTRWAPVEDVEAHLDRVLRPAPDPGDLEAHVAAHGAAPADLPFVATVSPTSVMINGAHVLGDAVTLAQLLLAVATADPDAFAAIGDRARTADALRALARGLPGHGRGWLDHARHPVAPPAVRPVPTVVPPAPAFAGTVLDQAALRAITK